MGDPRATNPLPSRPAPPLPHGPVTIVELTAGLIWPRLLRAAAMAARPSRLLIAYLLVLSIAGVSDVLVWWGRAANYEFVLGELARGAGTAWERAVMRLAALQPVGAMLDIFDGLVRQPIRLIAEHPAAGTWGLAAIGPFVLLFGAAISRSAALEAGPGLDCRAADAIGFAAARWRTLIGATLIPVLLAALLAAAIAALGWLMLRVPGLNAVTSALTGLLLPLALALVIGSVIYLLAWALMVPAVTCDGSDAADAIQRAYAYIVGRPGRALLYAGVLALQGIIACAIAGWIVDLAVRAAEWLALAWLPGEAASALRRPSSPGAPAAAKAVAFWLGAGRLLFHAYVLSYLFSGVTLLYLLLRRVNDEQDAEEVWLGAEGAPQT